MIFVGVDPGASGGIAVLSSIEPLVYAMPMLYTGKGARQVYDEWRIADMLRQLVGKDVLVTIEKLDGIVGLRSAQAVQWATAGPMLFLGMCAAFQFRRQFVGPRKWQREMLSMPKPPKRAMPKDEPASEELRNLEKTLRAQALADRRKAIKAQSVLRARQLFPTANLFATPRSTVPSDGMAEALLIAEWGRRQHAGGALFAQRTA